MCFKWFIVLKLKIHYDNVNQILTSFYLFLEHFLNMPQEIRVLQCYKCQIFQTDIAKKINKWSCKMCNEKQSLRKEYKRGSGKDCRQYAQFLNDKHKIEHNNALRLIDQIVFDDDNEDHIISTEQQTDISITPKNVSKWKELLDVGEDSESDNETLMHFGNIPSENTNIKCRKEKSENNQPITSINTLAESNVASTSGYKHQKRNVVLDIKTNSNLQLDSDNPSKKSKIISVENPNTLNLDIHKTKCKNVQIFQEKKTMSLIDLNIDLQILKRSPTSNITNDLKLATTLKKVTENPQTSKWTNLIDDHSEGASSADEFDYS